jgi:hypothetical protein
MFISKHFQRELTVACLSTLLAACGGGSETVIVEREVLVQEQLAAAPSRLPAAPLDLFSAPVNPITVASVLDETKAVSATIGRTGGALATTGTDGTKYSFVVPPNALPEDTAITMTPIASTTNAPWSKALGVRFAPAGLQFYQFATLQIQPPAGFVMPIPEQVAMGAAENGDLFFALPEVTTALRIKVLHFTDYWFSQMTRAQQEAVRLRLPALAELALEHEVASQLGVSRQCFLLGGSNSECALDPDALPLSESSPVYKRWLDAVVKPAINAVSFCVDYKRLISMSLGLERQKALLGFSDGTAAEPFTTFANFGVDVANLVRTKVPFGNVLQAGMYACAKEASTRCTSRGMFELISLALGSDRQQQLLDSGSVFGSNFEANYLKYDERVQACYHFGIEFDSTLTVTGIPGAATATSVVSSRINDYSPMASFSFSNLGGYTLPGANAPLINTSFDMTPPACGSSSNIARGGGTLGASFSFAPGLSGRPQTVQIGLVLGNTGEAWTVTGCGAGALRYGPQPVWTDAFIAAHDSEKYELTGLERGVKLTFTQADLPLNGTTLLNKTWNRSVGNVQENTTLKVIHKPLPFTEPTLPPLGN